MEIGAAFGPLGGIGRLGLRRGAEAELAVLGGDWPVMAVVRRGGSLRDVPSGMGRLGGDQSARTQNSLKRVLNVHVEVCPLGRKAASPAFTSTALPSSSSMRASPSRT